MKNIIKLAVLFTSILSFSSANAGVLEVTGTAKATYNIAGSDSATGANDTGKGIGITNELAFTGTGELDNGWTWKYQVELDDNVAGNTTSDDTRLEVTTPYGTVAAYNTEGSLSTKYKYSQAAYGAGSDNGNSGAMNYGQSIDSFNNIQFHTPADLLPFGITAKAAFAPSATTSKNSGNATGAQSSTANGQSAQQFQVTAEPIANLVVGASYFEKDKERGIQGYESGGYYATYEIGSFTLGAGEHFVSNNILTTTTQATTLAISTAADQLLAKGFENKMMSIGFAVNDSLSLSIDSEKSEAQKRTIVLGTTADTDSGVEMDIQTLQAAYTMGGMTLSISAKDIENADYALGADEKETLFVVSMAF